MMVFTSEFSAQWLGEFSMNLAVAEGHAPEAISEQDFSQN